MAGSRSKRRFVPLLVTAATLATRGYAGALTFASIAGTRAAAPATEGLSIRLHGRVLGEDPERPLVAQDWSVVNLLLTYRWRGVEASLALMDLAGADGATAFTDNACLWRRL